MKKQIFLYLFVFTLLILLFQLVNSNNVLIHLETELKSEKQQRVQLQDSLAVIQEQWEDETYFSLLQNDGAQSYYEGVDLAALEAQLTDAIYETNLLPNHQKLIPFEPMGDAGFLINKVKVLNHKWIIADFTDGTYWGELFITYRPLPAGGFGLEVLESILYPLTE